MKRESKLLIAGIHTGVGKTIVSAVLTDMLSADYWKPIQTGTSEGSDRLTVANLIQNGISKCFPETYQFPEPISPHAAASRAGVHIQLKDYLFPQTDRRLIIESAGGLMSPISKDKTVADFAVEFEIPIILVSANYLGSINHTLMALEVCTQKNIPVKALVFSGKSEPESEEFIANYFERERTFHLPQIQFESANSWEAARQSLRLIEHCI